MGSSLPSFLPSFAQPAVSSTSLPSRGFSMTATTIHHGLRELPADERAEGEKHMIWRQIWVQILTPLMPPLFLHL